jgi:hypothetical protein
MALPVRQTKSVSSQGSGGPVTSLNVPKPTGVVADDYLVAAAIIYDASRTITPPAGWTQIARPGSQEFYVWVKRATGSEPATYVWTASAPGVAFWIIEIVRFSGVNLTVPYEQLTATRQASATSITHNIATTANDEKVISFAGTNPVPESPAPSFTWSGATEQFDDNFGTGLGISEADVDETTPASPSITVTSNRSGAEQFLVTLALNPLPVDATVAAPAATATASRAAPAAAPGIGAVAARAVADGVVPFSVTGPHLVVVTAATATASRAAPRPSSSRIELEMDPDVGGQIELVEDP